MIKVLIFDWGDTLMINDPGRKEPMAFWENISLVPGVYDPLIRLSRIYSLCIASNAVASNAELMMKALKRVKIDHFYRHLRFQGSLFLCRIHAVFQVKQNTRTIYIGKLPRIFIHQIL